MTTPQGTYTHNDTTRHFTTDIPIEQLSTNGKTTGPSEYVIKAGIIDKDKPQTIDINNPLSVLRAQVTLLQDNVNEFLTEQMANESTTNSVQLIEAENKLLDGADSDDD